MQVHMPYPGPPLPKLMPPGTAPDAPSLPDMGLLESHFAGAVYYPRAMLKVGG